MVDIQSPTAEIRRGKKRRKKKPQDENKMSASARQIGHKEIYTRRLKVINPNCYLNINNNKSI